MRRQASRQDRANIKVHRHDKKRQEGRTKTAVRFGNEVSFVAWLPDYNRDGLWVSLRKI